MFTVSPPGEAMLGILLMSYGSPNTLDEVEAYYTDIRHGRKPSSEEVKNLKERYQAIGGRSPLLEITKRVALALERKLIEEGFEVEVYVGMKHWHPYVAEIVREIARNRVGKLVAIPLAPHFSKMSIGGYREAVLKALHKYAPTIKLDFVESWHLHPGLLNLWRQLIENGLSKFSRKEGVFVLFTAHSLPERILQERDPYRQQLLDTSSTLARILGVKNWDFAFQSAGHTQEKWLGPDILEKLRALGDQNVRNLLVVPVGFFSEHLEILYDIDIEATELARELGLELRRTELPNDSPIAIEALSSLVKDRTRIG